MRSIFYVCRIYKSVSLFRNVLNRTTSSILSVFGLNLRKSNYQFDLIGLGQVYSAVAKGFPPQKYRRARKRKKRLPSLTTSELNLLSCYDLVSILKAVPLDCFFPHLVLQDLTCRIHRETVNEVYVSRDLVLGHVGPYIFLDLFF